MALEVFALASLSTSSPQQLATVIQCDASLAAELLRLANSSFYNRGGQKIVDLELAVTRLGHNRVGELAFATHALAAVSSAVLPWMDVELAWRRSVATGIAIELLIAQGEHQSIERGLLLSAIMQSLGRVVLATIYPQHYARMVTSCQQRGESLLDQERQTFPENHARVMSRLLGIWNIPQEVYQPLKYVLDDYSSLCRLPDPERAQVELVKLAVLVGRTAAGAWEPWDQVEFPQDLILQRLRIYTLAEIIEQTRADLKDVVNHSAKPTTSGATRTTPLLTRPRWLTYRNPSSEPIDFRA